MTVNVGLGIPDHPSSQAALEFDGNVDPPLEHTGKRVSATGLELGKLLDTMAPMILP